MCLSCLPFHCSFFHCTHLFEECPLFFVFFLFCSRKSRLGKKRNGEEEACFATPWGKRRGGEKKGGTDGEKEKIKKAELLFLLAVGLPFFRHPPLSSPIRRRRETSFFRFFRLNGGTLRLPPPNFLVAASGYYYSSSSSSSSSVSFRYHPLHLSRTGGEEVGNFFPPSQLSQ